MVKVLNLLFRRSFFLCLIVFVCSFLLGIVVFFPLSSLKMRAEYMVQRYGLILAMEKPELAFPLGLKSESLTVKHQQISHPPVTLSSVAVHPLWSTLIGENPGLTFSMDGWQGKISGRTFLDGRSAISFTNLIFDEQLSPRLPMRLRGELEAGAVEGVLPLEGRNRSQLQFELNDLQLTGLQNLGGQDDTFPIGQLNCTADTVGSRIDIVSLDISGPAFAGSGRGTLRLGKSPATSSVNLILEVTPGADFDPILLDMLMLVTTKGENGQLRIHLRGPLNAIKLVN